MNKPQSTTILAAQFFVVFFAFIGAIALMLQYMDCLTK